MIRIELRFNLKVKLDIKVNTLSCIYPNFLNSIKRFK